MRAGSVSPWRRVRSVMTRFSSMPVMPAGVPVVDSTRVSALIWSRERGSPAAWRVSAFRVSAARTATPSWTGSSAVR
jgi:hypothetical protein